MKTISKFQANDGTEFSTESDCVAYESLLSDVEAAMSRIKPLPTDRVCNFANGDGFIQQIKENVLAAYREILFLAVRAKCVHEDVVKAVHEAHEFAPRSITGRYLDDSFNRPLCRAWSRFMNIDSQWREWGQEYFAINPSEGKQIEITV